MPLPPITQNDIIMVGINTLVYGQRTLTTHYYRVSTTGTSPNPTSTMSSLLQQLRQGGAHDLVTPYAACIGTNQLITYISAQKVYLTRYALVTDEQMKNGTNLGPSQLTNTAGTITFKDGIAGRSHLATKHIGPLPSNGSASGLLSGSQTQSMNDLALAMSQVVSAQDGYAYTPVIYHKHGDGAAQKYTDILSWSIGTTARVMRRRTVSLGE